MKLSQHQIDLIEETLTLNDVVYDDVRFEIIDHIASQIEVLSDENHNGFEDNFISVFEKWKPQFEIKSNSAWLGSFVSMPKIALDKMVKYSKRHMLHTVLLALIAALLVALITRFFDLEKAQRFLEIGFRALLAISIILVAAGTIQISRTKRKTAYSYLFHRRSFLVLLQPLMFAVGLWKVQFFSFDFGETFMLIFFYFWFFIYGILDFRLVLHHMQVHNKLNVL